MGDHQLRELPDHLRRLRPRRVGAASLESERLQQKQELCEAPHQTEPELHQQLHHPGHHHQGHQKLPSELHLEWHVTFQRFKVSAPGDSINTDGIHIARSDNIRVIDSVIETGDDCISMGDELTDLLIKGVKCSPDTASAWQFGEERAGVGHQRDNRGGMHLHQHRQRGQDQDVTLCPGHTHRLRPPRSSPSPAPAAKPSPATTSGSGLLISNT